MRNLCTTLLFLLGGFYFAQSQSVSVSYFEVFTRLAHPSPHSGFSFNKDSILARINNVPDTASVLPTFVTAVNDPTKVDSIFYTLTNSQGQIVYSNAIKASAAQGNPAYSIKDKSIYFKVGPFPYLKKFTATVKVKSLAGQFTAVKSFTKS